jgi:hypothetical protein
MLTQIVCYLEELHRAHGSLRILLAARAAACRRATARATGRLGDRLLLVVVILVLVLVDLVEFVDLVNLVDDDKLGDLVIDGRFATTSAATIAVGVLCAYTIITFTRLPRSHLQDARDECVHSHQKCRDAVQFERRRRAVEDGEQRNECCQPCSYSLPARMFLIVDLANKHVPAECHLLVAGQRRDEQCVDGGTWQQAERPDLANRLESRVVGDLEIVPV